MIVKLEKWDYKQHGYMTVPRRNWWTSKKEVHSVSEHYRYAALLLVLHCINCINCIVFLHSCGVCYDRHFTSAFQECPLFALAIRPDPVKMTPCTPNWDKSTSAVTVHWGNVGALCFYLLPCAITSAATATSSIHQWHWSKKHCTIPELSCSEPRYRCRLIYITPNCQVCTC